jgi:hypothetical protein
MPVAAGVVGDADKAAIGAALDVAAESSCPARFDRRHDTTLDPAEVTGVRLTVSLGVAAQNVRHLQGGHGRR